MYGFVGYQDQQAERNRSAALSHIQRRFQHRLLQHYLRTPDINPLTKPARQKRFSDCGHVKRVSVCPSGVIVLCEVAGCAPHDGVRGWIVSNVVCGVSGAARVPTVFARSINLRPFRCPAGAFEECCREGDFAPRRAGREFRSGSGLLRPTIVGFGLPKRQHEYRDFACGGHGGLAEPASTSQADGPALQGREPRDLADDA